jgi:hypothetical protein
MQVGEIYYWDTNKAIGYDSRFKYHMYVGASDDGHAFLFINKVDYGGDDYPLAKADYGFFALDTSYVSLTGVISYTDNELTAAQPELKGRLSAADLQGLFNSVAGCKTMTRSEVLLVGNALKTEF